MVYESNDDVGRTKASYPPPYSILLKASLRIFAEADVVSRMLTEEINLQVDFAKKQTSKDFSQFFIMNNYTKYYPQFPVPKAPGEIPPLHAMIPYDGDGKKSKKKS